jgi:hypothetical protein
MQRVPHHEPTLGHAGRARLRAMKVTDPRPHPSTAAGLPGAAYRPFAVHEWVASSGESVISAIERRSMT